MKIELVYGELRFMNPAGPVHEGEVEYLTRWSCTHTNPDNISVRVQSSIDCEENRPKPDLVWTRKLSSKRIRPTSDDALLLIEVSDTSLEQDLGEKAQLYAQHGIHEYWVVDVNSEQIHVHRQPQDGQYRELEVVVRPGTTAPLCDQHAVLELNLLFDLDH